MSLYPNSFHLLDSRQFPHRLPEAFQHLIEAHQCAEDNISGMLIIVVKLGRSFQGLNDEGFQSLRSGS